MEIDRYPHAAELIVGAIWIAVLVALVVLGIYLVRRQRRNRPPSN